MDTQLNPPPLLVDCSLKKSFSATSLEKPRFFFAGWSQSGAKMILLLISFKWNFFCKIVKVKQFSITHTKNCIFYTYDMVFKFAGSFKATTENAQKTFIVDSIN